MRPPLPRAEQHCGDCGYFGYFADGSSPNGKPCHTLHLAGVSQFSRQHSVQDADDVAVNILKES